jgi:hypothetical protein
VLEQVEERSMAWVHSAYVASESLRLLPANGTATLLQDHFQHAWLYSLSGLFKLLALRRPSVPVEICLLILTNNDAARLSFVLDLLDSFLPLAARKRVLPLFESSTEARSEAGRRLFADLPASVDSVVQASMVSGRDWEQAIALDYTLKEGLRHLDQYMGLSCAGPLSAEVILRARSDFSFTLSAQAAAAAARRKTLMYSTLEKTIILKSATLFSAVAAETLSRVAQVADEVSFSAGATVYREGEPGTALYLVASGAVRIRSGGTNLAILRRGDPFGEIAVLNRDAYRAEATAVEDSVLLRIDKDDLFELMQASAELMQAIIGLLARRVVQVGDLLRRPEATPN